MLCCTNVLSHSRKDSYMITISYNHSQCIGHPWFIIIHVCTLICCSVLVQFSKILISSQCITCEWPVKTPLLFYFIIRFIRTASGHVLLFIFISTFLSFLLFLVHFILLLSCFLTTPLSTLSFSLLSCSFLSKLWCNLVSEVNTNSYSHVA